MFHSFLKVCHSFGQLKLLLNRYQPYYSNKSLPKETLKGDTGSKVTDLSVLHLYLSAGEWKNVAKLVKKMDNAKCTEALVCMMITALSPLRYINIINRFKFLTTAIRARRLVHRHTFATFQRRLSPTINQTLNIVSHCVCSVPDLAC